MSVSWYNRTEKQRKRVKLISWLRPKTRIGYHTALNKAFVTCTSGRMRSAWKDAQRACSKPSDRSLFGHHLKLAGVETNISRLSPKFITFNSSLIHPFFLSQDSALFIQTEELSSTHLWHRINEVFVCIHLAALR